MPPQPRLLGAVSLAGTDEEKMRREGYRVYFFLICRDNRIPAGTFKGMRPKRGGLGPRRATTRIWGKPGQVFTPDELLTIFRQARIQAWQRDRYGRDAWWYIEPQEAAEGMKWLGPLLQMPL